MQPSSARRRACSQVLLAKSESIVPPYRPSGPVLEPVTQVFTTRLALDSRAYDWPDEKALCNELSSVVVLTCAVLCCIVFVRPGAADELLEYEDMRYANAPLWDRRIYLNSHHHFPYMNNEQLINTTSDVERSWDLGSTSPIVYEMHGINRE